MFILSILSCFFVNINMAPIKPSMFKEEKGTITPQRKFHLRSDRKRSVSLNLVLRAQNG
jgi:hypothetical protein